MFNFYKFRKNYRNLQRIGPLKNCYVLIVKRSYEPRQIILLLCDGLVCDFVAIYFIYLW